MLGIGAFKQRMPLPEDALQGRPDPVPVAERHVVLDAPLDAPFEGLARIHFGMGCFWGAERLFWSIPGVRSTAVGYAGGYTANPSYHEVCSGMTGHSEVVRVVYDPAQVPVGSLLKAFWEGHDPTQGMRQGNDAGTQYRSVIHCYDADQYEEAQASLLAYQSQLQRRGFGGITTEVRHPPPSFYFAEDEHQQYLAKHPGGYCGLGGTGVACPVGLGAAE